MSARQSDTATTMYAVAALLIVFGCGVFVGVSGDLWWHVLRVAVCP